MSRETYPEYSKNKVNQAGDAVRAEKETFEQTLIIENWRASHTYILNTFQANLRRRVKNKKITFAQRLKRRTTIFDKLKRESGMALARMHDIAGCRLIFENIKTLESFRKDFHKAKINHKRKNEKTDGYNYIECPKPSGYRGVHDVYEYVGEKAGAKWSGLSIEIQYRTKHQHAWATAVEIAGSISENQPKFNRGDERHKEFFRIASEMIARVYENRNSCFPTLSNSLLVEKFEKLEDDIHLLRTLIGLNAATTRLTQAKNIILIFTEGKNNLRAYSYDNSAEALRDYFEFEKKSQDNEDIVLVRADNSESIRYAFRNYFSDAKEFVSYMQKAIEELKK